MAQIELKHPDADGAIKVPDSQKDFFATIGWQPVGDSADASPTTTTDNED